MWRWARTGAGAGVLVVLVARLGADPFVDGVRTVGPGALALALGLTAVTTVACAWRWRVVAARLGVDLPLGAAVRACYRSQFLNSTLPGGVLGDVHRGFRHGRAAGDLGRGLRSVLWERTAGQAVQVLLAVGLLLLLPSPVPLSPAVVVGAAAACLAAAVAVRVMSMRGRRGHLHRAVRAARTEARHVLLDPRVLPVVVATSLVAALGHAATFLVATRAAGVPAPTTTLLPLALLVLLGSAVPLNVAGWGPREGAAAWAFAAAGLGATAGVTVAVVYGVLALAATLPGAVLLAFPSRSGAGWSQEPAASATGCPDRQGEDRQCEDRQCEEVGRA